MLTPTQITRLLALPPPCRKELTRYPIPGRWYAPSVNGPQAGPLHENPEAHGFPVEMLIGSGWAWAPCDSVTWLHVAQNICAGWWEIGADYLGDKARFYPGPDPVDRFGFCFGGSIIDCALEALEKFPC